MRLWYIFILLILFILSFGQYQKFPKYLIWNSDTTTTIVGDITPPDSFDTAPVLTFTAPNQMDISWTPTEIDSTDIKELRFGLNIIGQSNNFSTSNPIVIPWATASVDSDTTVYYSINYGTGACFLVDTSWVFRLSTTLRDSNNNDVSMDAVDENSIIERETTISVDSVWYTSGAVWDSIYFRTQPTHFTKNNSWAADNQIRFRFATYRIPSLGNTFCNIPNADFVMSAVKIVYLSALQSDSIVGTQNNTDPDPIYQLNELDTVFVASIPTIWENFNGLNVQFNDSMLVASDSSLIMPDTSAPSIPTIVLFDTLGTDSTTLTLEDFAQEAKTHYWIVYSDTLAQLDTTGANAGDSVIYSTDTTNILITKWKHGLSDNQYVYTKIYGCDSLYYYFTPLVDSVSVPDMWPPLAGSINYHNFIPGYNDTLSITKSASTDVTSLLVYIRTTNYGYVLVYGESESDIDTNMVNTLLTNEISYTGDQYLIDSLIWVDEAGNKSTALVDTVFYTGTPNIYIYKSTYDSTHSVIDSFKIGINSTDYAASANWDMKIDASDTLTNQTNDTLGIDIPDTLVTQNVDTTYIWSMIKFDIGNWALDTSLVATFPARGTGDSTPPDSADTFIAIGQNAGKDTLRTIVVGFHASAKDTAQLWYKTGSVATSLTDSTANLGVKWAVSDSASHDTLGWSIDWADDYNVWVYMTQWDSLDNYQVFADINRDTTQIDSVGAAGGGETYAIRFNGDNATDTSYADVRSGAASLDGAITGTIEINSSYGEVGNGLRITTNDEYCLWTLSSPDTINRDSSTIWFSIKTDVSEDFTANAEFWQTFYDGSNRIHVEIRSSDEKLNFFTKGNGIEEGWESHSAVNTGNWIRVAVSWDIATSKVSVYDGIADSWYECSSSTYTKSVYQFDDFTLGENEWGAAFTENVYIDNVYLVNGDYQATDPYTP